MYSTMIENTTIEHLTGHELNRLKRMVLGYGNFTRTADKAGMPKPTLRDLILRGYGRVETVQKIRTILNEAA
jgi:hypothetical protein